MLATLSPHPDQKAVIFFSLSFIWLVSSFHICFIFTLRRNMLINLLLSVKFTEAQEYSGGSIFLLMNHGKV